MLTPPLIRAMCTITSAALPAVRPPPIVPVAGPPSTPSTNEAPDETRTPASTCTGPTPRSQVCPAGTTRDWYVPGASVPAHTVAAEAAAPADAGKTNTSSTPAASASTALARQLAHRSMSCMTIPLPQITDDAAAGGRTQRSQRPGDQLSHDPSSRRSTPSGQRACNLHLDQLPGI
jgi:hypothetical protein